MKNTNTDRTAPQSARFCQSCGMPLAPDLSNCGTEADGTKSDDYCIYCYGGGRFLADCTMEQMIDFCTPIMAKANPAMTEDAAREAMRQWFPTLKRWRNAERTPNGKAGDGSHRELK